jgi:hypothetical protein
MDCMLVSGKDKGLFVNLVRIELPQIYFSKEKPRGPSPRVGALRDRGRSKGSEKVTRGVNESQLKFLTRTSYVPK